MRLAFLLSLLAVISANTVAQEPPAAAAPAAKSSRAYDGTPSSAVTGAVHGLSVSRSGGAEVVWVAYPHGVGYRCIDYSCREIDASAGQVQ